MGRAKDVQAMEKARLADPADAALLAKLEGMLAPLKAAQPEVYAAVLGAGLKDTGIGSTIFALKPGDGSAREQAASCQKVLGHLVERPHAVIVSGIDTVDLLHHL